MTNIYKGKEIQLIMRILICLLIFPAGLKAQDYSPFGNSSYAGIYSSVINPALASYSPYNWQINLIGAELNANNNYARLDMPYSPYKLARNKVPSAYLTENGNPQFEKNWVHIKNSNKPKHAGALAYVIGPSVNVAINKLTIGLRTEAFGSGRAYCIDKKLANAIYYEFDSSQGAFDLAINQYNSGNTTLKGGTVFGGGFAALAFPISYRILGLKWEQDLAIGITPKLVWGMAFGGLRFNDVNVISYTNDSLILSPFYANSMYSTEIKRGNALDIGLVYTFKKPGIKQNGMYHKNKTKYHTRFGLAITNIGSINYKNVRNITVQSTGNIAVSSTTFEPSSTSNIDSTLQSTWRNFGNISSRTSAQRIGMPTTLNITADHQMRPSTFVSVQWTQSLRKRNSFNMRSPSSLKITPRYQQKYWEIGVPLSLMYDYRALRMGLYGRIGPLFIGTHSLNGWVNTRNTSDFDFFFGLNISHFKRPKTKKEMDKEGRTNKRKKADKCGEM